MIPANIDLLAIFDDLNAWGFGNNKIEVVCGLHDGQVMRIRKGGQRSLSYPALARVYNFWEEEAFLRTAANADNCLDTANTTT